MHSSRARVLPSSLLPSPPSVGGLLFYMCAQFCATTSQAGFLSMVATGSGIPPQASASALLTHCVHDT